MKYAIAIVVLLSSATLANATPPFLAGEGATAIAGAASGSFSGSEASGTGVGVGEGGSSSSSNSTKNDSTSVGVGLAQAPTAISGICGKGNKFAFGALEWTDFSSKCFNYMIALEAAKRGEWDLTNQWVTRADGM